MIVVDTNVISGACRMQPVASILAWLDGQAPDSLYISTMSLAEVLTGIAQMPAGRRREKLREDTLRLLQELFAGRILAFDEAAALAYSKMQALARKNGTPIGVADGIIAATAISRGFAVASGDVQPFRAAGLRVINPWK